MNEAIEFVARFYNVSKEVALDLYKDEIDAYISLMKTLQNNSK